MTDRMNCQASLPPRHETVCRPAIALLVGAWFVLGGCQKAVKWEPAASPPPHRAAVDATKRSTRGNPPFYDVFGHRYYVLNTSRGFRERGVASWYGKKFHGKLTSSGDTYDMHAMTAAHKTLPLPTKVRVRNLKNGRSVIVTVNDRGPFVDNRIIDLSYAAATQLDMIREGTALVEIEVLTETAPPEASKSAGPDVAPGTRPAAETAPGNLYLQVGAFGERANAQQLLDRLHGSGFPNAVIRSDTTRIPSLFRVRLGPIADVAEYDALVEKMSALQIIDMHLVSEPGNASGG